jgi:two-component system nitrate/nitrite response regulator NarP
LTKVVLADDHPMIQSAVASLLRGSDYRLAATASTGAEAIKAVEEHDPDILILDVQMPEGDGLHVLRQLRKSGEHRPVVLLTASLDDHGFAEALSLKVDGVVLKTSDPGLLIDCLDQVRDGGDWIDPALRERAASVREGGPRVALSPRERELVGLVRQGLRNRDIAERLGVTEGTVKVYLHSVFEKTGVANRTELAIRAPELIGA